MFIYINPLRTGNVWRWNRAFVSILDADGLVLKHQAISIHNTSIVDADVLVLKHQAISIHNPGSMSTVHTSFIGNGYFWVEYTSIWRKHEPTIQRLMHKYHHINGSVQERRNSIANTLVLHLSCTNPINMWYTPISQDWNCKWRAQGKFAKSLKKIYRFAPN